ncbi:alpha/beta hydrolase [Halobacillus salinarum]|uniref:Alpha/beta hydrolase n=1 Tax=Halobacillus salinarum TaxID=2932257 RepID=A0ABY4EMV5_9BACI|nr:alpha/beta hydrolase [Halobacillus salinarum]UOQ45786.1 alpha/beta hydrolase [Halobacillus salinarum]
MHNVIEDFIFKWNVEEITIKTLIDIGNKKLELWMKGKGKTIIIQPGLMSSVAEWEGLCEELSKSARVITYNRAGLGRSDKGSTPRNRKENARGLHDLIITLGVVSPIILGHSYGGLVLQQFAVDYSTIAGGYILVDSTSYDAYKLDEVEIEGEDGNSTAAWIEKCRFYSSLAEEDLQVEMADWIKELKKSLPSSTHLEVEEFMSNPSMYETLCEELEFDFLSSRVTNHYEFFPDTPTIVIGRDPEASITQMIKDEGLYKSEAEEIETIWQSLIRSQTKLNANTKYILAEGSGHSVHLDKPEFIKRAAASILNQKAE